MSKFTRSTSTLSHLTGLPLFTRMQESGEPLPMAIGLGKVARRVAIERHGGPSQVVKYKVASAIALLSKSRRYRTALAADGAMRHDAEGTPVGPVSEAHRTHAQQALGSREVAPTNSASAASHPL